MGQGMVINFVVNEVAGGWEPTDTRLGGSEEAVVRWAEEFVKQGHEVRVYRNGHGGFHAHNGVHYEDRELYGQHGGDICINVKSSEIPPKEPTIYLTNETNASDLDLSAYQAVVWPSQWCIDNIDHSVLNANVWQYVGAGDFLINNEQMALLFMLRWEAKWYDTGQSALGFC